MKTSIAINHVLAVVPVSDFIASQRWYERLFARQATNIPMNGLLAEWRLTDSGWVQMTLDGDRAGEGLLNFAVDDLDELRENLVERGLEPEEIIEANKDVRLCSVSDPDGNRITFVGGFREVY
jgi:hypothetical protein